MTGSRYIKHSLIGLLSVFLIAIFLVQFALGGALFWLKTENGQRWVQAQIQEQLEPHGYMLRFSRFSYSFPQGLRVHDLEFSDTDGLLGMMDYIVLRPRIFPLAAKQAKLGVEIGTLTLYRLPSFDQKDDKGDDALLDKEEQLEPEPDAVTPFALQPFEIPDLHFYHFALNDLQIGKMILHAGLAGEEELKFAPRLRIETTIKEQRFVDLSGALTIKPIKAVSAISVPPQPEKMTAQDNEKPASAQNRLPEKIELRARIDSSTGAMNIERFSIQSPDIIFETSAALSNENFTLNGEATLPEYKQKGLEKIKIDAQIENPFTADNGHVKIQTAYQDVPIILAADIQKTDEIISVEITESSAPDLSLSGQVEYDTALNNMAGAVELRADNLARYNELSSQPLSGSGVIKLALKPHVAQPDIQSATLEILLQNFGYDDVANVQQIAFTADMPYIQNIYPERAELRLEQARLEGDIAIEHGVFTLQQNTDNTAHSLLLDIRSILQGQAVQLGGAMDILNLIAVADDIKMDEINADAADINASDNAAAKTPQIRNIDLTLGIADETISIRGAAGLDALDIAIRTREFLLASLPGDIDLPPQFSALALDLDVAINGSAKAPKIESALSMTKPLEVMNGLPLNLSLTASYEDGMAQANLRGTGEGIEDLSGEFSIPVRLAFYPFDFVLSENAPLRGALNLRGKIDDLAQLALPPDQELRGNVSALAEVSGTLAAPLFSGQIDVENGYYTHAVMGGAFHDLSLQARLDEQNVQLVSLSAHDGADGRLSGSGVLGLTDLTRTNINLQLGDFHLFQSRMVDGTLSSALNLSGQRGNASENSVLKLAGTIDLGAFDIRIPERFHASIPQLNIVESAADERATPLADMIALEIAIRAENRIFVRGWGLDAEFGGALDMSGTLGEPAIHGTLSSIRGRYEEFGKRFDIDRANLRFQGSVPPSPYLDIVASTDAGTARASITLSGAFEEPSLRLSSVPAMPQDEILSRILFGRDLNRITPFQAIQLKQTVDRFTGRGGGNNFDPLSMVRSVTGLDDIRVDTDEEGVASVGVGKYLTEKVYLEVERSGAEGSGAAKLQIELTPRITVESEVGQDAQGGAGVFWRWDY
ncbi:MAG: translocation/assembly module TamB domain-containing protein [Alphaproteobacteria bacterium]